MRILCAAAAVLFGVAAPLLAQPASTFPDLPLRLDIGDEVSVEDTAGAVLSGRVTRIAPDALVIAPKGGTERVFAAASVRRVEKRGDPLVNGARLGALIGGALGGALGAGFSGEFRGGDLVQGALFFGGAGLLLGLGFDAMHIGHTTVYAAPALGREPGGQGSRLAVRAVWRW